MFEWRCCFRLDSVTGYVTVISFVAVAVASSPVLLVVVGRAKKCLDFCATMYLWHAVAVCIVSRSVPASVVWWLAAAVCVALSTVVSEMVCLRQEMKEIPVSGTSLLV